MISYWLFTFAGKNTNIGREKDQYFCIITKKKIETQCYTGIFFDWICGGTN